ncbi:MAG: acetyl/propionyl/methylcrotonyl-CoA carboxylase subunit alpha [Acidiferrobacterales bacterium]|nr:acetyl/propionyl/methylcrotonyl-CoA carboxylase subunit alpha [Acidiferrobacterales bacterium]
MFQKILIANRGEIACRVMRTAKRLGIDTVAVYSDPDRGALHVETADEAIRIGPAPAAQSYLNIDAIIDACQQSGAQAVHPGYGFLSEDPNFPHRLNEAGITFIGPGADAIRVMSDKIESKLIARQAGVNTIPGFDDIIDSPAHAVELARQIGYPVMLKPTSAGGGKGMRLAFSDDECREGFVRSQSEAKTHFGDDRVFVEKFIENPRHIEVQIIADQPGHVLHLGERECSLQRRHQKVIEEAPSPFLNDHARRDITSQAVALAQAVNYVSAGTVEFVVDPDQNFYFLEMNTRLQVEHPVTESVTGIDLVECMIRVAAGEELGFTQSDIKTTGWAVESRIYAEDPARNFLPSTGRLIRCRPPAQSKTVRVDTGVVEGGEVSVYYDPMIAKLVTHADTRTEAFDLMASALDEYQITGVISNLPFLQRLVRDDAVLQGDMTTTMIEQRFPEGYDCESADSDSVIVAAMIANIMHYCDELRSATLGGQLNTVNWTAATDWIVTTSGNAFNFTIEELESGHRLTDGDGGSWEFHHDWRPMRSHFYFTLNGRRSCVQVARKGIEYQINHFGHRSVFRVLTPAAAQYDQHMIQKDSAQVSPYLKSPMPGLLVEFAVEVGQSVKKGEPVAVVEAMKMENTLRAERDGVVVRVMAEIGDSLASDQPIVEFGEEQ